MEPSLFVGAAAGHPFCILAATGQRHCERYKVQNSVLGPACALVNSEGQGGNRMSGLGGSYESL